MGKLLMNSLAANIFIFILFMRQIPVSSLIFSAAAFPSERID